MPNYPSPFPLPPSDRVETKHHVVGLVTREATAASPVESTDAMMSELDFDPSLPCETERCMTREHHAADYLIDYTHPRFIAELRAMGAPTRTLICRPCWTLIEDLSRNPPKPIAVIVRVLR